MVGDFTIFFKETGIGLNKNINKQNYVSIRKLSFKIVILTYAKWNIKEDNEC